MAEEARLESVCTPKGYREFESRSLRFIFGQKPLLSTFRGGFSCFGLGKNAPKMHRVGVPLVVEHLTLPLRYSPLMLERFCTR